jgi:hypothetical protein
MSGWIWTTVVLYLIVALLVFIMHMVLLQMVTFPLALLRSLLWPVWLFGGLRGTPLPMD